MPESAMIMSVGAEMMPAVTAVSPSTRPPTMETTMPTYFGMRTLASLSISKISKVKNISLLGENGMPLMLLTMVSRKVSGMTCR